MESLFSALKSLLLAWFNVKLSNCVISAVLFILCVVTTLFAIWPVIHRNPYVLPRKIKEGPRKPCKGHRTRTLKAIRVCLRELEEARNLALLLQRRLRKHAKIKNLSAHDPPWPDSESDQDAATLDSTPSPSPPPARFPPPRTFTPSPSCTTSSTSVPLFQSNSRPTFPQRGVSPSPPPPRLLSPFSAPGGPDSFPPPTTASSSLSCTSGPPTPQWESQALPLASTRHVSSPSSRVLWPAPSVKTLSGVGQAQSPGPTLSREEMRRKTPNLRSSSPPASQEKQLSCVSPAALICREPMNPQAEAARLSFLHPDFQQFLEMLIHKKVERRVWKRGRREDCSDGPLNSWGKVFVSLGGERDSTGVQSWDTRCRSLQLLDPGKAAHPDDWRACLSQTFRQLYWGLPFLHSESLVAPVRFADPMVRGPSTVFNPRVPLSQRQILKAPPSPVNPVRQALPAAAAPPQPQVEIRPPCQTQIQMDTEVRRIFTPPATPPGELNKSFLTAKSSGSSFPSALPNAECPPPKKLQSGGISPPMATTSQHVHNEDPADLHQPSGDSHRDTHGLSRPAALMGQTDPCTKDRGVRCPRPSSLEKQLRQHLGHSVGQILRDVLTGSATFPLQIVDSKPTISRRESLKLPTMDQHKRDLERFLTGSAGRKWGETKAGEVSKAAQSSNLVAYRGRPNAGPQRPSLVSSKGRVLHIDTSQRSPDFIPHFMKVLEGHVVKLQVRHRWLLPLKILRSMNIFKIQKFNLLLNQETVSASPPSHLVETESSVTSARVTEKLPLAGLGDRAIREEPVATPVSSFPVLARALSVHQDPWNLRTRHLGQNPQSDAPRPSAATLPGQTSQSPPQAVTYRLVSQIWNHQLTLNDRHCSEELNSGTPIPRPGNTSRAQPSQELYPHQRAGLPEATLGSQLVGEGQDVKMASFQELSSREVSLQCDYIRDIQVYVPTCTSTSGQSLMKRADSTGSPAEETCDGAWALPEWPETRKEAPQPAKDIVLRDCSSGALLHDSATEMLLQECQEDAYLAADVLALDGTKDGTKAPHGASREDSPFSQFLQCFFPSNAKRPKDLLPKSKPIPSTTRKYGCRGPTWTLSSQAAALKAAVGNILEEKITTRQPEPAARSNKSKDRQSRSLTSYLRIPGREPQGMVGDTEHGIPKDDRYCSKKDCVPRGHFTGYEVGTASNPPRLESKKSGASDHHPHCGRHSHQRNGAAPHPGYHQTAIVHSKDR